MPFQPFQPFQILEQSKHLISLRKVDERSRGGTDFFARKYLILKSIVYIKIIIIVKGRKYKRVGKIYSQEDIKERLSASVRTRVEQRNRLTLSHVTS